MTAANIISMVIFIITALIMLGIGISNIKSSLPVGFYTGEEPPKPEEISDVGAWNTKHGIMWISYGIIIVLTYVAMYLIGEDNLLCLLSLFIGLIVPILFMILYHHRLIKKYKK